MVTLEFSFFDTTKRFRVNFGKGINFLFIIIVKNLELLVEPIMEVKER